MSKDILRGTIYVPPERIHIAEQTDRDVSSRVGIGQGASFVEEQRMLDEEARTPVDWSPIEQQDLRPEDSYEAPAAVGEDSNDSSVLLGKTLPREQGFMPRFDTQGRHRIRPNRHTRASVSLGLEEPRHPLRGRAVDPAEDYRNGDREILLPDDRITHRGDRVVRVRLPEPRPGRGVYRKSGDKTIADDADGASVHSAGSGEDRVVLSLDDAKPVIDESSSPSDETVDVFTLCREQSLRVAGNQAILEDDLVDRVVSVGGRARADGNISLDALREREVEVDAQESFDYATTGKDLRE